MSGFEVLRGNEAISALSEFEFPEERCTFFQSSAWLRLWSTRPRYECGVLIQSGQRPVLGVFPFCIRRRCGLRECYSMPMGTYGSAAAPDQVRGELCEAFMKWASDSRFSRINVIEYSPDENRAFGASPRTRRTTQLLRLDRNPSAIYDALADHHKRRLKKASRFESRITEVSGESQIQEYFRLARESARRHGSAPTYGLSFYVALRRAVPDENLAWRLLYLDDKPCVGHICFKWEKQIISWDGCSDELARATSVNYSLYWHNITEFSRQGFTSFNFGSSPVGVEGVTRFKSGWGAEDNVYFEYDIKTLAYRSLSRLKNVLGR